MSSFASAYISCDRTPADRFHLGVKVFDRLKRRGGEALEADVEIFGAAAVLDTLDRRLSDSQPVAAQGMALLRSLLTDGGGPLYRPTEPGALDDRLRAATTVLEPEGAR